MGCGKERKSYWVDLQVPWFARLVQVYWDFCKGQAQLVQRNVHAMSIRAAMIGVEGDFVVVLSHDVTVRMVECLRPEK